MTTPRDQDELDPDFEESGFGASWGLEIELDNADPSVFLSARRVILDGDCVQVQLLDGSYDAFPIGLVRKILAMRATTNPGYTDDEPGPDEIY